MARNPTEDVHAFDTGGWRKYGHLTGKQRQTIRQKLSEGTWDTSGTWDQNMTPASQASGTLSSLGRVGQDPEMSNRVV